MYLFGIYSYEGCFFIQLNPCSLCVICGNNVSFCVNKYVLYFLPHVTWDKYWVCQLHFVSGSYNYSCSIPRRITSYQLQLWWRAFIIWRCVRPALSELVEAGLLYKQFRNVVIWKPCSFITSWKSFYEKAIITQLTEEYFMYYRTWMFTTIRTRIRHLETWLQCICLEPNFFNLVSIFFMFSKPWPLDYLLCSFHVLNFYGQLLIVYSK